MNEAIATKLIEKCAKRLEKRSAKQKSKAEKAQARSESVTKAGDAKSGPIHKRIAEHRAGLSAAYLELAGVHRAAMRK